MTKIKKLLNKFRIRKVFLFVALLFIILIFVFVNNYEYILLTLFPNILTNVFNFFKAQILDPMTNGQHIQVIVKVVVVLLSMFVLLYLFKSVQRDVSLWWYRLKNKPFNDYQYGRTEWADYYEKRKRLNRCYFDNINVQGTIVEVVEEKVFYFFGFPILIKKKPLFESNTNITNENLKQEGQNYYVKEDDA